MERKTIRFPKSAVERAEGMVEDGEYPNFSAAVRDRLLDKNFHVGNIDSDCRCSDAENRFHTLLDIYY